MKKVALIILDGWGIGDGSKADAIANANTPFVDSLYKKYPHSTLRTSGENVGLPDGQMGNSEVGHLNIGAGRIVYQDLALINKAIREKTIDKNPALIKAFDYAKQNNKAVHFIGLVSEGGVHSSQVHLHYLCDLASTAGIKNVFIHAFTDGRDCDPKSGLGFLQNLQNHLDLTPARMNDSYIRSGGPALSLQKGEGGNRIQIASVVGRYYAMDRDKRWERVKYAYDLLVKGEGKKTKNILSAVEESYAEGVTDEFIKPIVQTDDAGNAIGTIKENDVVICFNFRTDRCREITTVLTQTNPPDGRAGIAAQGMDTLPLYYVTMTNYDHTFKNVHVLYDKEDLKMTLGEVLEKAGKTQIRIAETEKYPHVTFFFSGGREKEFVGEKRIMAPSAKVATYDLKPEMSAIELTDAIVPEFKKGTTDFICLNYANADMVGHTGVYDAVIKAVETVDACTKRIVEAGLESGYSFIIIADHGNADCVINPDGSPNTAHTTNPVPCILIDNDYKKVKEGKLSDIAPTILKMMGLEIPKEMNGDVLV